VLFQAAQLALIVTTLRLGGEVDVGVAIAVAVDSAAPLPP